MGIVTKTSTVGPVTVPLACDPTVLMANPPPKRQEGEEPAPWPLALFEATSDRYHPAGHLVVPEDATLVTFRPLSIRELETAEGAAGERSAADAAVYAAVVDEIEQQQIARVFMAEDRVMANLPKEKREAYQRHHEWSRRKAKELVRAAVIGFSDLPHLQRGATGFPVAELEALDAPAEGSALRWPPGLDSSTVIAEVARHIVRFSSLGKAVRPYSGSGSGSPTGSASAGCATASASATDTCPAPDPSPR